MRSTLLRPVLVASLFTIGLATAGSATTPLAAQDNQDVPRDRHDDNGFDKGLLGLIGLAGLLGLKRRDDRDVRHDTMGRADANPSSAGRL